MTAFFHLQVFLLQEEHFKSYVKLQKLECQQAYILMIFHSNSWLNGKVKRTKQKIKNSVCILLQWIIPNLGETTLNA